MAKASIEQTTAFQEHAELERLRKFRDAVERIAITDYFSGKLEGFLEADMLDDEVQDRAWELVAAEIEPLRRECDRADGVEVPGSLGLHDDEGGAA